MNSELSNNLGWYIQNAHFAVQTNLAKMGGINLQPGDGPFLFTLLDKGIPKDLIVEHFEALECGTYGTYFAELTDYQRRKFRILIATFGVSPAGETLGVSKINSFVKALDPEIAGVKDLNKLTRFWAHLITHCPGLVTFAKLHAACAEIGVEVASVLMN